MDERGRRREILPAGQSKNLRCERVVCVLKEVGKEGWGKQRAKKNE